MVQQASVRDLLIIMQNANKMLFLLKVALLASDAMGGFYKRNDRKAFFSPVAVLEYTPSVGTI